MELRKFYSFHDMTRDKASRPHINPQELLILTQEPGIEVRLTASPVLIFHQNNLNFTCLKAMAALTQVRKAGCSSLAFSAGTSTSLVVLYGIINSEEKSVAKLDAPCRPPLSELSLNMSVANHLDQKQPADGLSAVA